VPDGPESVLHRWTESPLWQELERRDRAYEPARRFLVEAMPRIESVLMAGSSSPKDFTLHDAGHSFRVTEWMARLIPSGVLRDISHNEVAQLLLAAYLHDTGMTPQWGRVSAHHGGFRGDELDRLSALPCPSG
jgi:molecular chaperone HtpG